MRQITASQLNRKMLKTGTVLCFPSISYHLSATLEGFVKLLQALNTLPSGSEPRLLAPCLVSVTYSYDTLGIVHVPRTSNRESFKHMTRQKALA